MLVYKNGIESQIGKQLRQLGREPSNPSKKWWPWTHRHFQVLERKDWSELALLPLLFPDWTLFVPISVFPVPGNLTSVAHSTKLLCSREFWLPSVNQKPWQSAQRMGKEAWLGWLSHVHTLKISFAVTPSAPKSGPFLHSSKHMHCRELHAAMASGFYSCPWASHHLLGFPIPSLRDCPSLIFLPSSLCVFGFLQEL